MGDELRRTVKIRRDRKVGDDGSGRNVWTKPIEEVELELVSTATLKRVLESGEKAHKARLRELADGKDGVLARSSENNEFQILAEDDFTLEPVDRPGGEEELSLVTTQALRRILKTEGASEGGQQDTRDEGGGYNPYDSG